MMQDYVEPDAAVPSVVRRVPAAAALDIRSCKHDEGITIVSGNVVYRWCSKGRCGAIGMKPKGSQRRAFTWVQTGERGEDRAVEMRKQVNRQHKVDQCLPQR